MNNYLEPVIEKGKSLLLEIPGLFFCRPYYRLVLSLMAVLLLTESVNEALAFGILFYLAAVLEKWWEKMPGKEVFLPVFLPVLLLNAFVEVSKVCTFVHQSYLPAVLLLVLFFFAEGKNTRKTEDPHPQIFFEAVLFTALAMGCVKLRLFFDLHRVAAAFGLPALLSLPGWLIGLYRQAAGREKKDRFGGKGRGL